MRPGGRFAAAALVVAGAVVACGGPPAPGVAAGSYLEQGVWTLQSVDDLRVDPTAGDAPWLRVLPSEGRVTGSAGCNTFSGPYRAGGTTVTFGPLAVTLRACSDPHRGEIERRMLDVLRDADGYRIADGRLEILVNDRIRMLFQAGRTR